VRAHVVALGAELLRVPILPTPSRSSSAAGAHGTQGLLLRQLLKIKWGAPSQRLLQEKLTSPRPASD
jgi:hypothetical protein